MSDLVGNPEDRFSRIAAQILSSNPQFDGEEPFSLTIPRTTQGQHNQIEVFAEMTEQFTEDKANTTVTFSVYDAEYRALVIKPIPNTLEGDADYVFFVSTLSISNN